MNRTQTSAQGPCIVQNRKVIQKCSVTSLCHQDHLTRQYSHDALHLDYYYFHNLGKILQGKIITVTTPLHSLVSPKSFHITVLSCWFYHNTWFAENMLSCKFWEFLLWKYSVMFIVIHCSVTKINPTVNP